MPTIDVRYTDTFPEPAFARLQKLVFADIEQTSAALAAVLEAERAPADAPPRSAFPLFRFGAYDGEELVGWTYGWMERSNACYMANSGVIPSHRRQGIYTALMDAVRAHAMAAGAWAIRSQHAVVNNAVIIAKLRAGFHVSGLSQSAHLGTLVELTLHLSGPRQAMFRQRVLPYVVPDK